MKINGILASLAVATLERSVYASDTLTSLRGSPEDQRRALRVKNACTLVVIETEFEDELADAPSNRERLSSGPGRYGGLRRLKKEKHEVKCELKGEDKHAAGKSFVTINGIETDDLENIVSGDTTLITEGATIMDGEMWLPVGAAFELGSNGEENRRRLASSRTTGTKKVLVVRANARDSTTTATNEILADKIFGTHGDIANLRSQYKGCSHGQIDFQPFQGVSTGGTHVENGVLDVTVNMLVTGANRYAVEDALEEAASKLVGNLSDQFDHVMLCLPPGSTVGSSTRGWVAYGYVNSWLSVYNDVYCESLSTQVHEIGHNLGLAHSGKDGVSYGDKSGMMGYSYNRDNYPMQCFNPAKSYQLGWYSDRVVDVDPNAGTWLGTVIGGVDYKSSAVSEESKVVVKVQSPSGRDVYIGYNRKKGSNFQTSLAGDRITLIEQGEGYSQSEFIASLRPGFSHTFYDFGGSGKNLVVSVTDMVSYNELKLAIYYDTCAYPSCCEGSMCNNNGVSLVGAPLPTSLPISAPQTVPNPRPTPLPTPVPTTRPTPEPTPVPTRSQHPPTPAPTRSRLSSGFGGAANNKRPQPLLTELFREGLGVFNGGGNSVSPNLFNYIMTAKFELNTANQAPYMETELDLKGTSIIQVNFWYNIQRLQSTEGFKLQYSTNGRSWKDVREFSFGNGDFEKIDEWNYVNSETFEVDRGTASAKVRFVAETNKDDSKSVFYITGVNVYGIAA